MTLHNMSPLDAVINIKLLDLMNIDEAIVAGR